MTRAILFDCFGVLTESRWTARISQLDPGIQQQVRDVHQAYERGFVEYPDYREQIMHLAGLTKDEADEMFIYRRGYHKNSELLAHIAELSKNYRIGILSNAGTSWVRDTLLDANEVKLFDDMVLSFEVGLTKPDPAIYELACQRLDIEPNQAVFVDDQEGYCTAAREVGMEAILYKNSVQFKQELEALLTDSNH